MSTVGPIDHIARHPLPWRTESGLTECGKTFAEVDNRVVGRTEIEKRIRDWGKQRAAFSTCMTCATTSDRWTNADGHRQAILAVGREAQAVGQARPPVDEVAVHFAGNTTLHCRENHAERELWDRRQRFAAELQAITALIAAHPEEFAGFLADHAQTVSLAEHRTARRRRAGGGR